MRDNPSKSASLRPAKKSRKARRRRLEIKRMRSLSVKQEQNPTSTSSQGRRSSSASSSSAQHCYSTSSSSSSSETTARTAVEEEKKIEEAPFATSNDHLRFGHVSVMGRRRSMEDVIKVAPPNWLSGEYSFFAVYDGHGGAKVAETCGNRLDRCLEKHILKAKEGGSDNGRFDWKRIMVECFSSMDEELTTENEESVGVGGVGAGNMGTTALVVLVGRNEFVVASCGDSRAVLCRSGAAVAVTTDHKPDRDDEKERIEAAGGRIINFNGWRVQGVLATSRALGDQSLKPYVSSEPEVTVMDRSDADEFLIMATDGLFDVVCNSLACEIVKKCLSGRYHLQRRCTAAAATTSDQENAAAEAAAAALVEFAIAKGSRDNVSVIVVQLK